MKQTTPALATALTIRSNATGLFILVGILSSTLCGATPCPEVAALQTQAARDYLMRMPIPQDTACIVAAIEKIDKNEERSIDDTDLFIRYLDVLQQGKQGIVIVDKDNVGELFPAARAIIRIGPRALPSLLGVIKGTDETYARRRTAARTVRLIYGGDSVRTMHYLLSIADSETGKRHELLVEAASWVLVWCDGGDREACSAIYKQHTAP